LVKTQTAAKIGAATDATLPTKIFLSHKHYLALDRVLNI